MSSYIYESSSNNNNEEILQSSRLNHNNEASSEWGSNTKGQSNNYDQNSNQNEKIQILSINELHKQQNSTKIGDSEFIIRRKTPSMQFQEKQKFYDNGFTPIKEDQDNEDLVSNYILMTREKMNQSMSSQHSKLSSIPKYKIDIGDVEENLDALSNQFRRKSFFLEDNLSQKNHQNLKISNLNINDYFIDDSQSIGSPLIKLTDGNINDSNLLIQSRQSSMNFDKLKILDTSQSPLVSPSLFNQHNSSKSVRNVFIFMEQCEIPSYDQHLVTDEVIQDDEFKEKVLQYTQINDEQVLINLEGIKLIIQAANSIGGLRKLKYQFRQQRRQHFALSQYQKIFLQYKQQSRDLFDKNVAYILEQILEISQEVYTNSFNQSHQYLSDQDLQKGLSDVYSDYPDFLYLQMALDISQELENYIMNEFTLKSGTKEYRQLQFETEELLEFIRCLGEDMIWDKYDIEIDTVYNYVNEHQQKQEQQNTNIDGNSSQYNNFQNQGSHYKSSNQQNCIQNNEKEYDQLAIFTIEESDENNQDDSSFLNSSNS
eukprot:403371814